MLDVLAQVERPEQRFDAKASHSTEAQKPERSKQDQRRRCLFERRNAGQRVVYACTERLNLKERISVCFHDN
jgi:hypothetical protein